MRIKITAASPLPPLKAWFNIRSESSIQELKHSLRVQIPQLQTSIHSDSDFHLQLEEFELLDNSDIDILRDGDSIAVCVSVAQQNNGSSMNRPKIEQSTHLSSSDSTSASESDSESTSSLSDTEDEAPLSDSTPSAGLTKAKVATTPLTAPQPHVPPGQGKATTHSRNLRRRKKKAINRLASQSVHLNPNDIPISRPSRSSQPLFVDMSTAPNEVEIPFIMSSLSNKNKRKGFKSAMASALPQKIIFVDQGSPDLNNSEVISRAVVSPDNTSLDVRLVPPSEKQENGGLPQNIFVTSVDVEADSPLPAKKRRRNPSVTDVDHGILESSDRGEPFCQSVVWREEDWLSGIKVEEASQVQTGKYLAWKELGLHPTTFTPEMLLTVGRVLSCGESVSMQLVQGAEATNGRGYFGTDEEGHDVSLSEEPKVCEWVTVLANDWRIVTPKPGY